MDEKTKAKEHQFGVPLFFYFHIELKRALLELTVLMFAD